MPVRHKGSLGQNVHRFALPTHLPLLALNYATKHGDANPVKGWPASSGGGVFNTYPSPDAVRVDAGDSGTGLPLNVVATQLGKLPDRIWGGG